MPLAAASTNTTFKPGVATFYAPDSPGGACLFVQKAPGGYTTALGPDQFAGSAACGMTPEVKGRRGTVRGKVIDRHGNRLRSVEVSSPGRPWQPLSRTGYNHWLAGSGAGKGPFSVRVTDVRGHRVTLPGITLSPGTTQRSTVRMYGAPPAAAPVGAAGPTGRSGATSAAPAAASSSTGRRGRSRPGPAHPAADAAPGARAAADCR